MLVTTAEAARGRLDGALISVGGPPSGSVLEASDEAWTRAVESVFLGGIRVTRTVADRLADEVAPRGVRLNALLPGRIDTERLAELDEATGDPAAARERALGTIPMGRCGEPAELSRVAAFLLSPAASFVTGAAVPVDGAMLRAL